MTVLKNFFQVDDLVGVVADGEHGDLVQDLHGAVDAAADPRAELGRVFDPGLQVSALPHRREQAAEIEERKKNVISIFGSFVFLLHRRRHSVNGLWW